MSQPGKCFNDSCLHGLPIIFVVLTDVLIADTADIDMMIYHVKLMNVHLNIVIV